MAAPRSDALVLFGVTGDLAHKMILPALHAMARRGALEVPVIGVAFPQWSLARLRPVNPEKAPVADLRWPRRLVVPTSERSGAASPLRFAA